MVNVNELARLVVETETANRAWIEAKSALQQAQSFLEMAQEKCNKAELAYYDAAERQFTESRRILESSEQ